MDTKTDKTTQYKPDALPSSITRKLYVHYRISGYFAGQIDVFDFPMKDAERVVICEPEVTISIPTIDKEGLRSKALNMLEDEKQKVLAENHARLKTVQDKIDNLLAIEYQPGEAA